MKTLSLKFRPDVERCEVSDEMKFSAYPYLSRQKKNKTRGTCVSILEVNRTNENVKTSTWRIPFHYNELQLIAALSVSRCASAN